MTVRRSLSGIGLVGLAALVAALGAGPILVAGADHLDAPTVKHDGRIDITDLYVFSNGTGTALVVNVNPLMSPASTKTATFRPSALYQIKIDTNGDAAADVAYRIRFSGVQKTASGATFQDFAVRRATGPAARTDAWDGALVLGSGVSTPYGGTPRISTLSGGGRAFAGPRDDPFFFDLAGFIQFKSKLLAGSTGLTELLGGFTGTDTFKGTNISSIVLTVPNSMLGGAGHGIGVWATTSIPGSGGYHQVERMARPAINTVFNHNDQAKEGANRLSPVDDRAYDKANVIGVLDAIGHVLSVDHLPAYTSTQKAAIANVLLPDTLTFKVGDSAGFLNGRRLANDVIDAEFALLTNGNVKSDGVNGNDVKLPGAFPFLAAPH